MKPVRLSVTDNRSRIPSREVYIATLNSCRPRALSQRCRLTHPVQSTISLESPSRLTQILTHTQPSHQPVQSHPDHPFETSTHGHIPTFPLPRLTARRTQSLVVRVGRSARSLLLVRLRALSRLRRLSGLLLGRRIAHLMRRLMRLPSLEVDAPTPCLLCTMTLRLGAAPSVPRLSLQISSHGRPRSSLHSY